MPNPRPSAKPTFPAKPTPTSKPTLMTRGMPVGMRLLQMALITIGMVAMFPLMPRMPLNRLDIGRHLSPAIRAFPILP